MTHSCYIIFITIPISLGWYSVNVRKTIQSVIIQNLNFKVEIEHIGITLVMTKKCNYCHPTN